MAFRGWFALGGREFANSSRVVDAMRVSTPDHDQTELVRLPEASPYLYETGGLTDHGDTYGTGVLRETAPYLYTPGTVSLVNGGEGCGCSIRIPYDDSWQGLGDWLGDPVDSGGYGHKDAPWYDVNVPESTEFMGVWIMSVDGLGPAPVTRSVSQAVLNGASASAARVQPRTVVFDALVVACTEAGAWFGMRWLAGELATSRYGDRLDWIGAHPHATAATADSLSRSLFGVVLTEPPDVTDRSGLGGAERHRQASVLRASFTLAALDPQVWGQSSSYGPQVIGPSDWTVEPIQWAHESTCDTPGDCEDMPVLISDVCAPRTVPVEGAPVPTCSGCLPVCETGEYVIPLTLPPRAGVSVTVHNRSTSGPVSLRMWFYQGTPPSTWSTCEQQTGAVVVSGLPADQTAVVDGVRGELYGLDAQGNRIRQVGVLSGPSGRPWTPVLLPGAGWSLVVQAPPDADVDVSWTVREAVG